MRGRRREGGRGEVRGGCKGGRGEGGGTRREEGVRQLRRAQGGRGWCARERNKLSKIWGKRENLPVIMKLRTLQRGRGGCESGRREGALER